MAFDKSRATARMSEKLDICLVMCPPYGPESPPLSLASLVEAVRHKGFTAHVEDVNRLVEIGFELVAKLCVEQ